MNEDRLNAFEVEIGQNAQTDESRVVRDIVFVRAIITAYHQLGKANAELLAALKPHTVGERHTWAEWQIAKQKATEVYTKHKGE